MKSFFGAVMTKGFPGAFRRAVAGRIGRSYPEPGSGRNGKAGRGRGVHRRDRLQSRRDWSSLAPPGSGGKTDGLRVA